MPTPYKTLVETEKLIAGQPNWVPKNAKGDDLKLVAALRLGGRAFQGLELIGRAQAGVRNAYTSFTLVYMPTDNRRDSVRLCRVDWRPITKHSNDHINTPADLIGDIFGTHHHPFDLNWSEKNGCPLKALPIAQAINPDFQSFKEFLDGVGRLFRISNAGSALKSPWPGDLFG